MFFIYYYVKLSDFCEALEARQNAMQTPVGSIDPATEQDRERLAMAHRLNRVLAEQERRLELDRALYHLSRPWLG